MGISSPHTGTEVWTQWLSDPKYTTYITPEAETASPDVSNTVDLTCDTVGTKFELVASMGGEEAIAQVQSGRTGTLPIPQISPAPPVEGYTVPQSEHIAPGIVQALMDTKVIIQAYTANQPPMPDLEAPQEPSVEFDQRGPLTMEDRYLIDVDNAYQKLAEVSLYVAACTARLVTYNIMSRLAAALGHGATDDYDEAVTMGRKEIREIIRMAPHFFRLMGETGLTNPSDFPFNAARGYESSSSSDNSDSSRGSGDGNSISRTQKQLPNLAKSYIGMMIMWPIGTAASTDLIDAEQYRYILGMVKYITEVCGIRMGDGIRQYCVERRELSGLPFFSK